MVDDEPVVLKNCEKILVRDGYEVELARSGEEALGKLNQKESCLILIDLKMPGMDGTELLSRVRKEFPHIIPVIITGYATIESAVKSMKEGAYDYIPKPFTIEELLLVVRNGMEKRRLIDEAEKLRREKEAFILMVYHELKAPLSTIYGYLQNLSQRPLPEPEMKIVSRCYERTKGLMELVDDLLRMGRFQKTGAKPEFALLQLTEILPQFIDLLQDEIKKNNISVHFIPLPGLPLIKGNKEDLETAFANIIRNAIRYNKSDGKVDITVNKQENYLVVKIADTGIGISKDDFTKIFDEFYRVKNDETRQIAGTGLGLAIARQIIESHNGHIEVESELGKGSIFSVFLPIGQSG